MQDRELKIVIRAVDEASASLDKVRGRVENLGNSTEKATKSFPAFGQRFRDAAGGMAVVAAGASVALFGMVNQLNASVDAANRYQAAITGLASVSRAFGESTDAARLAAVQLAQDGLMTVGHAATGLKNLLAAGFSLDQAIQLMNRFKDSAAFGRQSALTFGDAVTSATEGIKNGNSILVDNAGVTKNLSMMLEEAGFSAQDLMKASSDAGVRQAIFNGILTETRAQLGDSAKLSESFAGAQARAAVATDNLQRQLGLALQPVLTRLLEAVTPLLIKIAEWIENNPRLAATLFLAAAAGMLVFAVLGAIAAAIGVVVIAFGSAAAAIGIAIAAVIAGIVALGVAVALNLDKVKAAIKSVPDWIRAHWAQIGAMLLGFIAGPVGVVISQLNNILGLFDRIKNAAGAVLGGINKGISTIKIPGFARGVENFGGGLAVVGERGPELVSLPRGANVYSNERSQQMAGGMNVQIDNVHLYTAEAADAFFARLGRNQELAARGLTPAGY